MTIEDFLKSDGITKREARQFVRAVCKITDSEIVAHPEKNLTAEEEITLMNCLQQRKQGVPLAYITENKDFYKDSFTVKQGVLIPQFDTEILVEKAVELANKSPEKTFRILDLCSGTGCIGISVAKEISKRFDDFEVILSDISPVAFECSKKNAEKLLTDIRYEVRVGDLFSTVENERFDMILTNPPYIASAVIPTLDAEVRSEPALALDGGSDGLDIIRKIVFQAHDYLNAGGYLLMEIGYDQGKEVAKLFRESLFTDVEVIKDLASNDRVVKGLY